MFTLDLTVVDVVFRKYITHFVIIYFLSLVAYIIKAYIWDIFAFLLTAKVGILDANKMGYFILTMKIGVYQINGYMIIVKTFRIYIFFP